MIVLPLGHNHSVRNFPYVTVAIMVVCLLVQVRQSLAAPGDDEVAAVIDRYAREEGLGRHTPPTDAQREELRALLQPLRERDWVERWGYRPARPNPAKLVTNAFLHAGWLHLIGNMLFLWMVGANLEDRWGRRAFSAFYLVGGAAAALSWAAVNAGQQAVLVGASGAIAACMGAFLVTNAGANIRLWYFIWLGLRPYTGTTEVQAYWALPAWFLQQLVYGLLSSGAHGGVAYSAHIGGFAFGLAVAAALKLSGLEARYLLPITADKTEWKEDPEFLRASELLDEGKEAEALPVLKSVLARAPRHAGAREALYRVGLAHADEAAVQATASEVVLAAARERDVRRVLALWQELGERAPNVALTDRALAGVARAAFEMGEVPVGVKAVNALVKAAPQSPVLPGTLFELASAQERVGRADAARRTLETLVAKFPRDHFAEQARKRLEAQAPAA